MRQPERANSPDTRHAAESFPRLKRAPSRRSPIKLEDPLAHTEIQGETD